MLSSIPARRSPSAGRHAFTLVEVLVSLAVLMMIFVMLMQFFAMVDRAWRTAAADPFAEAENAFEVVTSNLAGATLEGYPDYADASGAFRSSVSGNTTGFVPDHLARRSDLAFVCGPAAGPGGLLAASGRTATGDAVFCLAPRGETQTLARAGMDRLLNALGYFPAAPLSPVALAAQASAPTLRNAANLRHDGVGAVDRPSHRQRHSLAGAGG